MPLNSLLELVETLRERIDEHGASLRQNEMRTRYALIDPLLQGLSWDTSNPSEVMIEDGSGDGRADYLLFNNNRPVMIIEAKRLGLGVTDGRQQAVNYAMDSVRRARYFTVTDGNQWEIYDTHQPAINMMIVSFALREDRPSEVCLKVLSLWRPGVGANIVSAGRTPLFGLEYMQNQLVTERVEEAVVETPAQVVSGPSQPEAVSQVQPAISEPPALASQKSEIVVGDWIPLPEFDSPTGTKPNEIQFPDDSRAKVIRGSWAQLMEDVVRWLYENELLNESNWNFTISVDSYLVSDTPVHPSGKEFSTQKRKIDPIPLFVETRSNTKQKVEYIVKLLHHVGQDPSQFKVRLSL